MESWVFVSRSGINSLEKGAADKVPLYPVTKQMLPMRMGIQESQLNECAEEHTSPQVVFWPRWVDSQPLLRTVFCVKLVVLTVAFILAFIIEKNFHCLCVFTKGKFINLERVVSEKKSLWTVHLFFLSHLACHGIWVRGTWLCTVVDRAVRGLWTDKKDMSLTAAFFHLSILSGLVEAQNL